MVLYVTWTGGKGSFKKGKGVECSLWEHNELTDLNSTARHFPAHFATYTPQCLVGFGLAFDVLTRTMYVSLLDIYEIEFEM
jgi:hypothetical protein